VLAHATGFSWDEALMVLAPVAALMALLLVANNRAKKLRAPDERGNPPAPAPHNADEPPAP